MKPVKLLLIVLITTPPFLLSLSLSPPLAPPTSFTNPTTPTITCPHFDDCSGCVTSSSLLSVEKVKSSLRFFRSHYPSYTVSIPSPVTEWRTSAKLAVRPYSKFDGGCVFGLFKSNTHEVSPIPSCTVHHPSINKAIKLIEQATIKTKTSAFKESSHSGMLRYIMLQVERRTNLTSLTLVWNAETYKDTQPHLSRLVKELKKLDGATGAPKIFHSIWVNYNGKKGNAISSRGDEYWERLAGPEFIRENLFDDNSGRNESLFFTPSVFRQGNYEGFTIIAKEVANYIKESKLQRITELYAGVGLLGLTAAAYREGKDIEFVRCSDENPANLKCFQKSKKTLGESAAMVTYVKASASDAVLENDELDGADALIVDPPRKGLDEDLLNFLVDEECEIETLIYVSCGFDSLASNVERLLLGGWKVEKAKGYLLFPGSNHIENLVILKKK